MNAKLTTVSLAALAAQVAADKCYALAFSSGDLQSAYQAGVLKGLIAANGAEAHSYSAVSGMSGGAVNAAILGSYDFGKEAAAADRMIKFWEHASTNTLYKDWIGGIYVGISLRGGLYNNSPMTKFLKNELKDISS